MKLQKLEHENIIIKQDVSCEIFFFEFENLWNLKTIHSTNNKKLVKKNVVFGNKNKFSENKNFAFGNGIKVSGNKKSVFGNRNKFSGHNLF